MMLTLSGHRRQPWQSTKVGWDLRERHRPWQSGVVTKRGVEAAVLVPIDQWRRLERIAGSDLKELLLAPEARTEALTPPREKHRHRVSPAFQ